MANILVIDDNKDILQVVQLVLEIENHAVDIIDNGEDGLAKLKQKAYDLVFLDIMMPNMSGLDVIKNIREFDKQITVVAITAMSATQDKELALKSGFNDYVTKPFRSNELLDVVKRYT